MASRSSIYGSSPAGKPPRSTGGKTSPSSQAYQTESMVADPSGSQSAKKRKVVDLTLDDEEEEDEETTARAQATLAGMNRFIICNWVHVRYFGTITHPNVPPKVNIRD
jgi:hypothetical protein